MKGFYPYYFLVFVFVFLACQKQGGENTRIVFDAQLGSSVEVAVETKATTPLTSMTSFYVSATAGNLDSAYPVWNSDIFLWSDMEGAFVSSHRWPSPDQSYHFYASNEPIYNQPGSIYVNADNGRDVLCAYLPSPDYLKKNTLTFYHILARLGKITVKPGTVFGDDPPVYYSITNVTIKLTPWERGKYDIIKGYGKDDGTGWLARGKASAPVVVAQTTGPLSSVDPYYSQDNDVWLVPETYAILLSWTVQHETWIRTYDEIPAAVPLKAGMMNDITFILGGDKSLVFELHTTPQDVVTRDYTSNDEYNNLWD